METLIILKLHYCLHDLMFQTTFLQGSPFILKKSRSFRKTQTSFFVFLLSGNVNAAWYRDTFQDRLSCLSCLDIS